MSGLVGLSNLLGLAKDGLAAQGFALNVTGQNVANVNTPGYVKRSAIIETRASGEATYGGVVAVGVERSADQFLDARAYEATSFSSSAKSRDSALTQIEALFNDAAGSGLNDALSGLFSSFSALAATPNDPTARTAVLDKATYLANRMRDTAGRINAQRSDLLSQARGTIDQINGTTSQIAKLNSQIAFSENTGNDAADLKDQRDKLVSSLSEKIDTHVFSDSGGKIVIVAGGSTLVEGDKAMTLSLATNADGSMQILGQRPGGTVADLTSQITGGTLGGMREARDTDATAVLSKLDRLAYDVATAVNTQHAAGVGLDGVTGRNLFSVSGPVGAAGSLAIDAAVAGQPNRLAAAANTAELPSGSGNASALATLADKLVATGGTRSPFEAYSDLVGDVGQRKASSAQNVELRGAMESQAKLMRESVSGVSMDEEMVNMSRYQRGYEAASRLLRTADELLASLIRDL